MEQYQISRNRSVSINEGQYFRRIHAKHIETYKPAGAANIVQNVRTTYKKLMEQLANSTNHNSLLVGKVQSGKTSNLELLTALAFDNGYNLLIIYGGYDKELLRQCTERFSKTFEAASEDELIDSDKPVVFTTNETTNNSNPLSCLTVDFAQELIEENRPIIITCLKRPGAIKKVNGVLLEMTTAKLGLKPFIIDDEGDQASLNTAKEKATEGTPTYKGICIMKKYLENPLYLSVTATPQANIFQEDISELIPATIHLIQPGDGYDGASIYHLSENNIIHSIKDDDATGSSANIHEAVNYFLIASTAKSLLSDDRKGKKSDMIIHTDRTVKDHERVFSTVSQIILLARGAFDNKECDSDELNFYLSQFNTVYQKYFSDELKLKIQFDEKFIRELENVVHKTGVILQNANGKITKESEKTKLHKIFIGGDLLQRGLTFPNLLVSYFTRFAKNGGNMDTTLQRARWFGYRSKYLELCKIFTTDEIAKEFAVLAEIEDDLWEQFDDVEKGILKINDIIIQAEETRQKPTARNKAKFKQVSFKNRWIKQKFIVENDTEIAANNKQIEDIVHSISDWETTTEGSVSGTPTAIYTMFTSSQLIELIKSIETAFDREPFCKKYLVDLVDSSDVPVILMGTGLEDVRYRSVFNDAYKDRIKALHQGANTTNEEQLKYLGDKKVIVDPTKVNIQIHHVEPGLTKDNLLGKQQYMFAIYIPKDKHYFIKDND